MNEQLKSTDEYKKNSFEDTMKFIETTKGGLSEKEADIRIRKYGYNELKETTKNQLIEFLKRYWGPMPWLLEFSVILTVILKHYTESGIIFVLLTINAIIGYLQSQNSQKAVELLKKKLEINANVLRDGNAQYKRSII